MFQNSNSRLRYKESKFIKYLYFSKIYVSLHCQLIFYFTLAVISLNSYNYIFFLLKDAQTLLFFFNF